MDKVLKICVSLFMTVVLWTASMHAQLPDSNSALKVLTTRAIATVLNEIGNEFEIANGYKLDIRSDIAIRLVRQIQAGEAFDVLIASPEQIDALIHEGKIIAESRTDVARSGIGVSIRKGGVKPDISSKHAFKTALLNAKSIAFLKEGQSGLYVATMIEQLGLTEALQTKIVRPDLDIVSELVAKGEVELGIVVITQILTTNGVELVGPLPQEIQSYVVFAAGASTNSTVPKLAKKLINFLRSPQAIAVMKSQGMHP